MGLKPYWPIAKSFIFWIFLVVYCSSGIKQIIDKLKKAVYFIRSADSKRTLMDTTTTK